MDKLTFGKEEVLATLITNRERHRTVLEKSFEAYKKTLIAELKGLLAEAEETGAIRRTYIMASKPENHLKDYDVVIKMLQSAQDMNIEFTPEEFKNYMLDEWEWKMSFCRTVVNTYY